MQATVHFSLWAFPHLPFCYMLFFGSLRPSWEVYSSGMSSVSQHGSVSVFCCSCNIFSGLFSPFFFSLKNLLPPPAPAVRSFLEFVCLEVQRLLNNLPLWGCPGFFCFVLVHLCWNLFRNLAVKVPTSLCSRFSVKGSLPSALSFHFSKIISEGICTLWGWQCPSTVPLSESIALVGTA